MAKKLRQKVDANPRRTYQVRPSISVSFAKSDETLDSFKEEIGKIVLKWLSGKLEGRKKEAYSQTVNFSMNGPGGSNPPSNPQNINIVNVIVSCPHVQDCPHYKGQSEQGETRG